MIQHDDFDRGRVDSGHSMFDVAGMLNDEAAAMQVLLHQAREGRIIIDIENADGLGHRGQAVSGTCITEKNRPSWRIALANPS